MPLTLWQSFSPYFKIRSPPELVAAVLLSITREKQWNHVKSGMGPRAEWGCCRLGWHWYILCFPHKCTKFSWLQQSHLNAVLCSKKRLIHSSLWWCSQELSVSYKGQKGPRITFYHWYGDYWPSVWLQRARGASGHTSFLCNDNSLSSGDGHQCVFRI